MESNHQNWQNDSSSIVIDAPQICLQSEILSSADLCCLLRVETRKNSTIWHRLGFHEDNGCQRLFWKTEAASHGWSWSSVDNLCHENPSPEKLKSILTKQERTWNFRRSKKPSLHTFLLSGENVPRLMLRAPLPVAEWPLVGGMMAPILFFRLPLGLNVHIGVRVWGLTKIISWANGRDKLAFNVAIKVVE